MPSFSVKHIFLFRYCFYLSLASKNPTVSAPSFLQCKRIYFTMKKVLTVSLVVIGCVVGAGFASGREMLVFFQNGNPLLVAAAFFVLFCGVTFLFLHMSKTANASGITQINKAVFGKFSFVFNAIFVLNYFLAASAMIAGCQTLFQKAFGVNFPFGLIVAILCAVAVYFGIDGIKKINAVLVPIIILCLIAVCLFDGGGGEWMEFDASYVLQAVKYVAYNAMLMCGLVTVCGKDLNKKQSVAVSVISASVLALLIFFMLSCFSGQNFAGVEMPMLFLAKRGSLFYVFCIVVACGIITSLLAAAFPLAEWAESKVGDRQVSVVGLFICAYIVSLFGFADILDFTLPITSSAAVVFVICLLFKAKKDKNPS